MKFLNKLGLYTKSDLKQAFKNGAISEQNKMYFINQENFVIRGDKIGVSSKDKGKK